MLYWSLTYVSILSILTPILFSLLQHRALNLTLRALFLLVIIGFLTEVICLVLAMKRIPSTNIFMLYTLIEGILLIFIYRHEESQIKWKKVISIILALYILIFVLTLFGNFSHEINSTIEAVILLFLSLKAYLSFLNNTLDSLITDHYFFWFNSAVFLYFGTSFFLVMFENSIRFSDPRISYLTWSIHLVSNIIFNTLLGIGIWKAKTK